jgi:hypothetical protein
MYKSKCIAPEPRSGETFVERNTIHHIKPQRGDMFVEDMFVEDTFVEGMFVEEMFVEDISLYKITKKPAPENRGG